MSNLTFAEQADAVIGDFFLQWNVYTTVLALIVTTAFLYPLLTSKEPDLHPFLLARQAQASPIRQSGQSAVYRSVEIPYGYPLRDSLAVKDPGAPKWTAGRKGDLRDIWRQAVNGPRNEDATSAGPPGKVQTVLGTQNKTEHSFTELTTAINVVGKYIQENGGTKVAVCLSNSAEMLSTIFAGAFHGFSPILIPYGFNQSQNQGTALKMLSEAKPDTLICEAGTMNLDDLLKAAPSLYRVIWVVRGMNREMDWDDKPAGVADKVEIHEWDTLIENQKTTTSTEVPPLDLETQVQPIFTCWQRSPGNYELVRYTSENLVSAVAAALATLPRTHKLIPSDTFLSIASLTQSYALTWLLASLYSNTSISFNSVAGDNADFAIATIGISPTIILASSGTMAEYMKRYALSPTFLGSIFNYFHRRTMAAGRMPLTQPQVPGSPLFNLRLMLISQPDYIDKEFRLESKVLSGLRLVTGVRCVYALTTGDVAGAVAQTNVADYRSKGSVINVGAPWGSVEVCLTGAESEMEKSNATGRIMVRGPAVSGGETTLELEGRFDDDNTLLLAS